jgi:hypothetical protein
VCPLLLLFVPGLSRRAVPRRSALPNVSLAEQFPDDPDPDEDPSRRCTRDGCERPRWSKHGRCQLCLEHAGKGVAYCLRVRQGSTVTPLRTAPKFTVQRQRYMLLRRAGAPVSLATRACQSERRFLQALDRHLLPRLP